MEVTKEPSGNNVKSVEGKWMSEVIVVLGLRERRAASYDERRHVRTQPGSIHSALALSIDRAGERGPTEDTRSRTKPHDRRESVTDRATVWRQSSGTRRHGHSARLRQRHGLTFRAQLSRKPMPVGLQLTHLQEQVGARRSLRASRVRHGHAGPHRARRQE